MADSLRWGILATGSIAHSFAKGLKESETGTLVAAGSRSQDKADAFAAEHGGKGYESYAGVLGDPDVDAVYIATPHHLHKDDTIATARAGKAVLCEKPFVLNAKEAEEAIAAVREANVFFMEAFMYRCTPQTTRIKEILRNGEIGEILQVNAEFGFAASRDWGNFRADGAVGGGGLMDVGSYCVSFVRMAFDAEPEEAIYRAEITERGYDAAGAGLLVFPGSRVAHFGTGIHVNLTNGVTVYGTEGKLEVPSPWFCSGDLTLHRNGKDAEKISVPGGRSLYAIEADTVARYIEAKEAPAMTVADTLGNMRALDMLRASAGLKFAAAGE